MSRRPHRRLASSAIKSASVRPSIPLLHPGKWRLLARSLARSFSVPIPFGRGKNANLYFLQWRPSVLFAQRKAPVFCSLPYRCSLGLESGVAFCREENGWLWLWEIEPGYKTAMAKHPCSSVSFALSQSGNDAVPRRYRLRPRAGAQGPGLGLGPASPARRPPSLSSRSRRLRRRHRHLFLLPPYSDGEVRRRRGRSSSLRPSALLVGWVA